MVKTFDELLADPDMGEMDPLLSTVIGSMVVEMDDISLVQTLRLALMEASYRVSGNEILSDKDRVPTAQELNACIRRTLGLLLESVDDV